MQIRKHLQSAYHFAMKIPPGLRSLAGLALMALGVVGFLPIVGFWMLPVGLIFIGLDIPATRRWVRKRLDIAHD